MLEKNIWKIFENDYVMKRNFLKEVKESMKSRFVLVKKERKKEGKKERKGGIKKIAWRKGEMLWKDGV